MRRTAHSATTFAVRSLFAAVTTGSLAVGTFASVAAEPVGDSGAPGNVVAALVDKIAQADQKIANLRDDVASKRQSVNQSVVDLQSAQNAASAASGAVKVSEAAVAQSDTRIKSAQDSFDQVVRAAYQQGNTAGALVNTLGGEDPNATLERATTLRIVADKQRAALGDLKAAKARAEASRTAARAAKVQADAATAAASDRKKQAEDSITQAVATLTTQEQEQATLTTQRELAQRALDSAKRAEDRETQQKVYAQYVVDEQRSQTVTAPGAAAVPTVPGAAAAPAAAAPVGGTDATVNTADPLAGARTFAQNLVNQAGSLFGITPAATAVQPSAPSASAPAAPSAPAPSAGALQSAANLSGAQAIDAVIARGMSVIGVQYAWGGGNAWGATRGVRDGGVADSFGDYNRIGFDCSGFTAYAFAAVGIALPKYSGYQYTTGKQYPVSQIKRGDMVFRGPGGTQHVAIYLGNNQILESPQSGGAVRVAPFDASTFLSTVVRVINS
ncbi:NlpC/P60 family protein [Tsukamurella strandjordii]|uniref:NlpC/P60 family protein n=1 Tax=Tsukamurella strandjordii TaxID=147577 RepID=A0AA90N9K7_9ACTN|nr:NlpC/P60 family protein [Tsukamurella strandjordii]MDP0397450.1 NlpC/P60 family protein [Tsukamurella strandjordii]